MKYQKGNFQFFVGKANSVSVRNSSKNVEASRGSSRGWVRWPIRCKVAVTSRDANDEAAICWSVSVVLHKTFYIHTLPQKFILLSTIRADTFFPWHDSYPNTE